MNCSANKLFSKKYLNIFTRSKTKSSAEYCIDTVRLVFQCYRFPNLLQTLWFFRQYDYENFICTLLLKNSARSCAFAVRGFNVEVARIAEQVSQPNIGLMRMKFWEETIDKCFAKDPTKVPQHPVAVELYKVFITLP